MPLGMDISGGIMADLMCHQAVLISTACHSTSPIDSLRFMKTREQWPVAACLVVYVTPQIDVNNDSEASVSAESSTGRGSKLMITIDEWPCLRKEGIEVTVQKAKTCRLKMRSTEIRDKCLPIIHSNPVLSVRSQWKMRSCKASVMKSLNGKTRVSLLRMGVSKKKDLEGI